MRFRAKFSIEDTNAETIYGDTITFKADTFAEAARTVDAFAAGRSRQEGITATPVKIERADTDY